MREARGRKLFMPIFAVFRIWVHANPTASALGWQGEGNQPHCQQWDVE
jgi:hypothetical protein